MVLALAVLVGVLAAMVNVVMFLIALLQIEYWTSGSYHHPALLSLQLYGGLTCLAFAVLGGAGLVRGRAGWAAVPVVLMFAAGAVASGALPLIHINEVNASPTGFAQASYRGVSGDTMRFYNPTDATVRVCVGDGGVCATSAPGPEPLRGNGLSIRPAESVMVRMPEPGDYPLTVVGAASGPDAALHVEPMPDTTDDGPPIYR